MKEYDGNGILLRVGVSIEQTDEGVTVTENGVSKFFAWDDEDVIPELGISIPLVFKIAAEYGEFK